jgi:hypothetical protein
MIKVHKAKIPTHLSFPLKTSMLETALQEIQASCPTELNYIEPESSGILFEAQYHPPHDQHKEPHLQVINGAVPAAMRKEMTLLLQENVILEFMVWLEAALKRPPGSPLMLKKLVFQATYVGGKLHISQEP